MLRNVETCMYIILYDIQIHREVVWFKQYSKCFEVGKDITILGTEYLFVAQITKQNGEHLGVGKTWCLVLTREWLEIPGTRGTQ
jgi:hypothetical protein